MKNLFLRKERMGNKPPSTTTNNHPHSDLINQFVEITAASIEQATIFLESHNFDLSSAVSTFIEYKNDPLITSFIKITSCEIYDAAFFLESHNFDLDSAVSAFREIPFERTTYAPNYFALSSPPSFKLVRSSSADRSRSPSPPPPSSGVGPTGGGGGASSVYGSAGEKEVTSADLNKRDCGSVAAEAVPTSSVQGGNVASQADGSSSVQDGIPTDILNPAKQNSK